MRVYVVRAINLQPQDYNGLVKNSTCPAQVPHTLPSPRLWEPLQLPTHTTPVPHRRHVVQGACFHPLPPSLTHLDTLPSSDPSPTCI